jgi:hypothetical protein
MEGAARAAGDAELALQAVMLRSVALLEQGDPGALGEHERFVAEAERSPFPRQRYVALSRRAAGAMLAGDFAEATARADEALAFGRKLGEVDAVAVWGDQTYELARLTGDLGRIDGLITDLEHRGDPHVVVYRAALAADREDGVAARRLLDELRALGDRWPLWAELMWLATLAELSVVVADPELIDASLAALAPHRDDWSVLAGHVLQHGPLRYWVGRLELAAGAGDHGLESFEIALAGADRLGARPWSIQCRLGLAEALRRRGDDGAAGDAARVDERADALLAGVLDEARTLGMAGVVDRAARLVTAAGAASVGSGGGVQAREAGTAEGAGIGPGDDGPVNEFRCTGAIWSLSYAGRTVQVPDAKGLNDLHTLVAQAGSEVAAADLLDPAGGALVGAARRLGGDAVLDERAKADYQRRLTELDETIEAALARRDDTKAIHAEHERDALLDELRRATGLGGRPRRLGDEHERARKTVTARIRDSLRKLDEAHPELATHLRASVSTGTTCVYRPTHETRWRL